MGNFYFMIPVFFTMFSFLASVITLSKCNDKDHGFNVGISIFVMFLIGVMSLIVSEIYH